MDYSEFPLLDFLSTKKMPETRREFAASRFWIFADNAHTHGSEGSGVRRARKQKNCITITLQRLASFGFASAGNKRGNCANEDESQYTRYCSCTCWGSRPADHLVSAEGADSEKQDLSLLQLTDADAKSKRHSGQAKVQSCPKIDQTYHLQVLHILDCLPI